MHRFNLNGVFAMKRFLSFVLFLFSLSALAQSGSLINESLLKFSNQGVEDWEALNCVSGSQGFWEFDDPNSRFSMQLEALQQRGGSVGYRGTMAARIQLEGRPRDLEEARRRGLDLPRSLDLDVLDRVELDDTKVSLVTQNGPTKVGRIEFALVPLDRALKGTFGGQIPGYHFELKVSPGRSALGLVIQSVFPFLDKSFVASAPLYPSQNGQTGSRLGSYFDPRIQCEFIRQSRINGRDP